MIFLRLLLLTFTIIQSGNAVADTIFQKTNYNTIGHYPSTFVRGAGENEILYFGNTEDSAKTGEWVYFYPDGKILAKGKYKNGKKFGVWCYYSARGEVLKIKWKKTATIKEEIRFNGDKVEIIDIATPGANQTVYRNGKPDKTKVRFL